MQAQTLRKADGSAETIDVNSINLQSPTIVRLQIAPEAVRSFEKVGEDLKLVLLSGEVVIIKNFFLQDAEGNRSDLVLQDEAGVDWWGQYTSPWSKFHFAEIEEDGIAGFPWWPAALALLGGGALAAGGGGGGGGGSRNRAPEIREDIEPQQDEDDGEVGLDFSKYFADPDGDDLTYTATGLPEGLSIDPKTGVISGTIDPSGSQGGTDGVHKVVITVTDPDGETVEQEFEWTVTNPAPTANDDTVSTQEDEPVSGNVLTGTTDGHQADSDPDGDDLVVTIFTVDTDGSGTPAEFDAGDPATIISVGEIQLNADGSYTFTPDADWNGDVPPIEYTISDGEGGTDTATLRITVTSVDDAQDDTVTTNEDEPVTIPVLDNDDFDGDNPTITHVGGQPINPGEIVPVDNGTVELTPGGELVFTPDPDWNGETTFDYTVVTDKGTPETAKVTVTVDPVVDVADDTATTDEDVSVTIDVLDNDTFEGTNPVVTHVAGVAIAAGDTVTVANGTVTLNADGTLQFTPVADWHGDTSFAYTAKTDTGVEETATATVTVTAVDDVVNDTATTDEDVSVTIDVLDNDTFEGTNPVVTHVAGVAIAAGDTVTVANGTVTFNADGTLQFTPVADWHGDTSFAYTAKTDTGVEETATATVTVTPVDDAQDDTVTTNEDEPVTIPVLDNDDFDGDNPLITHVGGQPINPNETVPVDNGTVTLTPGGELVFTPDPDWNGETTFDYTVVTDKGTPETAKVTVTVDPVVDVADDTATTDEDVSVTIDVLDNDTFEGTNPVVTHVAGVAIAEGGTVTVANGTVTLNADGTLEFTPVADWHGDTSFAYTAKTDTGVEETATVMVTVNSVNDAPVINENNQSGTVVEAGHLDDGTVVPGTPGATGTFSATDVDGDSLTWSVSGTPDTTYGTFSVNAGSGEWTYELDNTLPATQALNEGDSVDLTYTVEVSDGAGGTDTREVAITITGTNDAPVAVADTGEVTESGVLDGGNDPTVGIVEATGNVLDNDTDVDDGETDTLTVSAVSFGGTAGTVGSELTGTYGSLVLNDNGTYTYTLNNDDSDTQALAQGTTATEMFSYTAVDANGATSTSTLTITITGTNDQPEITSGPDAAKGTVVEEGIGMEDTATATGELTASDVDEGATQAWSIDTTDGTYGTITIDPASGKWTYTLDNEREATQALNAGDEVEETFTARVTDEHGAYAEQVITVSVIGANDAPVAVADTGEVIESGVLDGGNDPTVGIVEATGNVLSNDTDVDDGETATLQVSAVSFGGTEGTLGSELIGTYGSLVLNSDGTYTYTLDNEHPDTQALAQGVTATEEFSYTVKDVKGAISTSTLTITIAGTNDQPIITSDADAASGEVVEVGTNETGTEKAEGVLTASDIDDDATQTWSIDTTDGTYGTITIDPVSANGSIR